MNVKRVLDILEIIAPLNLTEDYDAKNGVQIEGPNVEVKKILVCLDVTPQTVQKAIEESCQMIVSHHHPIVSPIRTISHSDWFGRIIIPVVKNGITIYTAHTSYDSVKEGLNDYIGVLLGLEEMHPLQFHGGDSASSHGMGRIGTLKKPVKMEEFAILVKEKLSVPIVKIIGPKDKIVTNVAVGTGNGLALIPYVLKSNADVYVTGDIQYHNMREALQNEMALIAVEHDDTEKFFAPSMAESLRKFGINVLEYNDKFYHTS